MAVASSGNTVQWSSKFAFIMAAVGSSVGLGNLWRFSAEAGENGGGAFILIYLMSVVFVGMPVLMSEYLLGRAGQASSAIRSLDDLAQRSGASSRWDMAAWIGMIASFLIVSFYCVVAAWVMAYIPKFLFGAFNGLSPDQIADLFVGTVNSVTRERACQPGSADCLSVGMINEPMRTLPYFLVFAALTAWFVSRGVNEGIEWAAKVLMPVFFVILACLALYGVVTGLKSGGTMQAVRFLFMPDFSKVSADVAARALGQACFSLSIGSAIMITYGSYLPRDVSIPKSAVTVGCVDTLVALVAGFAIFPIMFSHGLDATQGAGLFFISLPTVLSSLGLFGNIIGAAFFILAIFAAITSSISLLEPVTAWVSERFSITKAKAAWLMGTLMVLLGMGSLFVDGFMDFIDEGLTGPIMLPLSALLVILFTGWRLNKAIINEQFAGEGEKLGRFLLFFVRFVAPVFVGIVLIFKTWERWLQPLVG